MNSIQYRQKLDEARFVTDPYDEKQLESSMQLKYELEVWWETEATEYMKNVLNVDLAEQRKNWRSHSFAFDLDPFGFVSVGEYLNDERGHVGRPTVWQINKADVFDYVDSRELDKAIKNKTLANSSL